MMDLAAENRAYWTQRAPSYTADLARSAANGSTQLWQQTLAAYLPAGEALQILDVGTGPGFFAILLTRMGHRVTAVDYTPAMLSEARANAGALAGQITFLQMDAQALCLPDDSFDVLVSRNLTWNLPEPERAYRQWYRVLRPGGRLLNFDADWYGYLFDADKQAAVERDRRNVRQQGFADYNDYAQAGRMEELCRHLPMGRCERPRWDMDVLRACGFRRVCADTEIWRRTWDQQEQVNFAATPGFLICADK